ncbi:MAG: hypothetical protein EBU34_04405, partial [Alphaproteobacteria bacterium]|nr:hypothetical protein [Alphaproteobacteria bacterium]
PPIDININQGITSRIKTNGTTNMTLSAPGYLNITTDVSMNGKSIDMSGGSFKNVRYSDISMNGNTIDMSGGAITRIGNQNFQTNIDIKQAGVSRIYTSGGTDMTIDPLGNLRILSDLSLNGNTLDMGAGYDDIRSIAYPSMETYFLKTGALTSEQVSNRKILRKAMFTGGFTNIPTEWWHFNAFSRLEAKRRFAVLR